MREEEGRCMSVFQLTGTSLKRSSSRGKEHDIVESASEVINSGVSGSICCMLSVPPPPPLVPLPPFASFSLNF